MKMSTTVAPPRAHSAPGILAVLALSGLLAHLLTSGNYGYFRDEFYFMAASRHLDFGYVDFPPMVALIGAAVHALLGDSLAAIHLLPALAGAALVALTGLMARELGGGRFAQGLAALATLVAPTILGIDSLFSMNPFDELCWGLAAYVVLLIVTRRRPWLWLLLGLVVGLGLMTKVTMFYFVFGLCAGFLLTPARRVWRTRWPWLAALIATLIFLPYVAWQVANQWPSLGFFHHYGAVRDPVTPLGFFIAQVVTMNPLSLPLWLAGLWYYFFTEEGRPYRMLGWAYLAIYALFTLIRAKYYYFAPAYPMLFAAGAVALEPLLDRPAWRWRLYTYAGVLAAGGLVLAIITLPALPPALLIWLTQPARLSQNLGFTQEPQGAGELPQPFADRFGWDTMTATVAQVYHRLPREQQAMACVLGKNYGEAGALALYGPSYGLPHVISGDDNFYLWGPGHCSGAVVLAVGWSRHDLAAVWADVKRGATISCHYCMSTEDNLPVYVCRRPRLSLQRAWPRFKVYI